MSTVVNESVELEVLFAETEFETSAEAEARVRAEQEIVAQNLAACDVEAESFSAFLELLSAADSDYIDAAAYAPEPEAYEPGAMVDWDSVSRALSESQAILIGVQQLLSETLAAMGVEDHEFVRVLSDADGSLRLVSDHPRREEIESVLNSPANQEVRDLYQAAISGMSLAGGLVGAMSVPQEILDKVKAAKAGAA